MAESERIQGAGGDRGAAASVSVSVVCLRTPPSKNEIVYLNGCASLEKKIFPKHESLADDLPSLAGKRLNKIFVALLPDKAQPKTPQVVGYLILSLSPDAGRVLKVAVSPSHRRLGVGRRLLDEGIACMAKARVPCVLLHVDPTREPAVQLYKSAGFECIQELPNYYKEGRDAWLMRREL